MPKRNLAWILVITMITLLMWQLPQIIAGRDAVLQSYGPLVDAQTQIRRRYVEDVDDGKLSTAAVDAGIRAMVREMGDPYALYLSDDEYGRFKSRTDGVFGGIGVDVWPVDDGLQVLSRLPDSPAARADILPGDVITHVDAAAVHPLSLVEAVNNLLNGPPETKVSIRFIRPSEGPESRPRDISLERTILHIDSVRGWSRRPASADAVNASGGWRFMIDPHLRVGYIRLTKFTPDVADRLDQAIEHLLRANLRGLILDLRGNTGGLLDSARQVADRFLESGLIVRVSGRKTDQKKWEAMREGTYPLFPMTVLVNGMTASAAEIVAGALRDHHRAAIVGERTFGKGSVQELVELDRRGGAIKLTTAFYYLPGGQCIHKTAKAEKEGTWGVEPTILVKMDPPQLARCLAAWRELARETLPPTADDAALDSRTVESAQPDKTRPADDGAPAERISVDAAKLLEADLPLARALEHLRSVIDPAGKPRSESADKPATPASRPLITDH